MSSTRPRSTITGVAVALLCLLALPGPAGAAADGALEAASEELRLRVETERRMRRDFETLLAAGKMNAAEIGDFEDYLVRLGMLVDQQRRTVAKLGGDGPQAGIANPLPKDFGSGQTDGEKIALLDAELGNSLSDFDEKLLREQQDIAAKSRPSTMGHDAENNDGGAEGEGEGQGENSAAEGEGEDGKSGGESPEGKSGRGSPPEQSGETGETGETGEQADQGESGGESDDGGDQVASAGGSGSDAGEESTPSDIGDGEDDDVVARQLREAAENEQDPELREKLWDEYRRYKGSTR